MNRKNSNSNVPKIGKTFMQRLQEQLKVNKINSIAFQKQFKYEIVACFLNLNFLDYANMFL